MPAHDILLESLARELERADIDPGAWALGAARVLPSVVLIPVFGLRALPLLGQVLFAFVLAAAAAPALQPLRAPGEPWLVSLWVQLGSGLPLALGAAISLWAASMAGHLLDQLRDGTSTPAPSLLVDSEASPLGILFALGAGAMFLQLGGPARLVAGLSVAQPLSEQALEEMVAALVRGIQLAILIAGPLLAVVPFFELLTALMARALRPIALTAIMAPLRSLALLALVALLLDRFLAGIISWMDVQLPAP